MTGRLGIIAYDGIHPTMKTIMGVNYLNRFKIGKLNLSQAHCLY